MHNVRMTKSAQPPPAAAPPEDAQAQARSEAARLLIAHRWAKTTPAERSAIAAQVAAHRRPDQMGAAQRDPHKERCPCGAMTLKRAQARRHKCEAPKPAPKKTAQRRKKA